MRFQGGLAEGLRRFVDIKEGGGVDQLGFNKVGDRGDVRDGNAVGSRFIAEENTDDFL